MAENTNTEATEVKSNEAKSEGPSAEELQKLYDSLPGEFKDTINNLNAAIKEHNANVDKVKRSEAKEPNLIKAEIFEQNPDNNAKIARLLKEYDKFMEAAEKL